MRAEEGMTLIELLIAMVIMSIGIAALVAGFSSGILSVNRARLASTAGALADKQMELYRQAAFTSLPTGLQRCDHARPARTVTRTGCRSTAPGPAPSARIRASRAASCSRHAGEPSGQARDDQRARRLGDSAKLLFSESATFDSSTG